MRDLCRLIGWMVVDLIRSRAALEADMDIAAANVLRRTSSKKHSFCAIDRLIFVSLYWLFPKICDALAIVKPDTIVRWHRAGSDRTGAGSRDGVVVGRLFQLKYAG